MKYRKKEMLHMPGLKAGITGVMMMAVLAFAACSPQGGDDSAGGNGESPEKPTINFAYVNWADCIALTNLAKVILEDKMGYEVELTMADPGPVYTAVAEGDSDAFLDAWLPVTHESYMEEYGDDLVDLGYNYEGARIGLVVPAYVDPMSIEDLNNHTDAFDGEIIGIDSGAGIMSKTDQAVEDYALDYRLVPSSGPVMTASLMKAIDRNESVVVTGWKPHWKFARWDLRFLDDPKGVYGKVENIHTVARLGLEEDMPDVVAFLRKFKLNDQQLGSLMGAINESTDDPSVVARQWMQEHGDLVNSWLPQQAG